MSDTPIRKAGTIQVLLQRLNDMHLPRAPDSHDLDLDLENVQEKG